MHLLAASLSWLMLLGLSPVMAETGYTRIPTQYIAALGDPRSTSGAGAETWGLWPVDPGPRGVRLSRYASLKAAGGLAPAKWTFDASDWWLEENGSIMEQPRFPIPAGKYVVTGDRDVTAVLTIHPKDAGGVTRWELDKGATLYDVTHLGCRAARYTPAAGKDSCSPEKASQKCLSRHARSRDAHGRELQQAGLRGSHSDRHGQRQVTAAFIATFAASKV